MLNGQREIIAYCRHNPDTIEATLGDPDYSYAFVLAKYLPLLNSMGTTQVFFNTHDIDAACRRIRAAGREPLLLSFTPPHRLPVKSYCFTIPVFAWEFDTIPDESWNGDERQNWSAVLAHYPGCITHSRFAVTAVRRSLGATYPICSLPAPVWDAFANLSLTTWTGKPITLHFTGTLLDSRRLGLDREVDYDTIAFEFRDQTLTLSDFVLTMIANPSDGRKNWREQLQAFVWTFRNDVHCTLVFKLIHHDRERVCNEVLLELRRLAPFRCRIVVIHGYLEKQTFEDLVRATTFVVNASRGEGQCLPLMEFMSASTPAIAPSHTAMADYITPDNAFLVRTSPEWTYWPQDPRRRLRCLAERLDWDSLCDAFSAAAQTARKFPDRYATMASAARKTLWWHCSQAVVGTALNQFLDEVNPLDLPAKANRPSNWRE